MSTDKKYAYYPGCSLTATAVAYDISTKAVCDALGIEIKEIDDWNCCGATEYFAINALPAYALVARNLALAQDEGHSQVIAPCSACFLNLRKTDEYMGKYPDLGQKVNQALAAGKLHYDPGSLRVRHLLDVVVNDVGLDKVESLVKKPLYNLRLAPYYGCMIVRPDSGFDNVEYPTSMDELLRTLGAIVVDYPVKTQCCGGHMTQISDDTALDLIGRLLRSAAEYQADAIVCLCPMCQLNLDAYQDDVNRKYGTDYKIPVLYFTQMMGLAFGIPEKKLGFGKEMVSAKPALAKITAEPPPKKKRRVRRPKEALPMPGQE